MKTPKFRIKTLRVVRATVLLACLFGPYERGNCQPPQTFATLDDALSAIRSTYKVQTGVEISTNDSGGTPLTLQFPPGDVARAFDELVRQRPQYTWSLDNGVYDLYPRSNTESLSELLIRIYSIKDATLAEASQVLNNLPEFQNWLSVRKLTRREFQVGPSLKPPKQKSSISLSNVPLHVILNKLVREFEITQWTIVRYGDNKQYVGVYFYN